MENSSLNPLDIAVLVVLLISALMAFARGFVREVLSVAAWIGAALATLWLFPIAAPFMRGHVETRYVADGITILAVFTTALIVFSIVTHTVSTRVQESSLSAVDRSLGFAFGIVRGAALLSLAYMFATWLWPEPPVWLREAKARPFLAAGADTLRDLLPNTNMTPAEWEAERARRRILEAEEAERTLDRLANPLPASAGNAAAPDPERGYNDEALGRLDQLIKNTDQETKPTGTGSR